MWCLYDSETQERVLKGFKIQKILGGGGGHAPRPSINLRLRRSFRKLVLSIYPRFTPECASCLRRTGLKGGSCAHKNTGSHHLKESCIESK